MKQWKVLLAAVLVCAALFAGCSNKKEPVAANPDPETIPTKAQEDKDAVLAAFQEVINNYQADTAPEYYAAFPDDEDFPDLSSVDGLEIVKGDDSCDVQAYVNLGGTSVNKLCISLKYVEAPAEGASNWMVVATSIATQK